MSTKPILFNTDMVRAILANRKTMTRRVVKPPLCIECDHGGQHEFIRDDFIEGTHFTGFVCKKCGYGVCGPHFKFLVGSSWIRPPYRPGDILYVREEWAAWSRTEGIPPALYYRADADTPNGIKWRPSILMPHEAARIFLRVTNVRMERLQDITISDWQNEGILSDGYISQYAACTTDVFEFLQEIWNRIIKPADRARYGWEANPYVWVIEFERCEKPEEELV